MNFDFLLNKLDIDENDGYININIIECKKDYAEIELSELKKNYDKIKNINICNIEIYPNYGNEYIPDYKFSDIGTNIYLTKEDYIYIMELVKTKELKEIEKAIKELENKKSELLKKIYK